MGSMDLGTETKSNCFFGVWQLYTDVTSDIIYSGHSMWEGSSCMFSTNSAPCINLLLRRSSPIQGHRGAEDRSRSGDDIITLPSDALPHCPTSFLSNASVALETSRCTNLFGGAFNPGWFYLERGFLQEGFSDLPFFVFSPNELT
jgi:hypothetical protein